METEKQRSPLNGTSMSSVNEALQTQLINESCHVSETGRPTLASSRCGSGGLPVV